MGREIHEESLFFINEYRYRYIMLPSHLVSVKVQLRKNSRVTLQVKGVTGYIQHEREGVLHSSVMLITN